MCDVLHRHGIQEPKIGIGIAFGVHIDIDCVIGKRLALAKIKRNFHRRSKSDLAVSIGVIPSAPLWQSGCSRFAAANVSGSQNLTVLKVAAINN